MNLTKEKRATFTPGPWYAHGTKVSTWETQDEIDFHGDEVIAETGFNANARLIAAAPEMYKVLQEILAPCPVKGYLGKYDCNRTYNARKKAREVLAKVEGGEG